MVHRVPHSRSGVLLAAALLLLRSALPAQAPKSPRGTDPATWLQVDSAGKVATVALIAAMNDDNNTFNFNGAHGGGLTLNVPVGWTVDLQLTNKDGTQSHGVDIIAWQVPIPPYQVPTAIPNATTDKSGEGIGPGKKAVVHFIARPAGKYYIRCTVPGHGTMGMWLILEIQPNITAPSFVRSPGAP